MTMRFSIALYLGLAVATPAQAITFATGQGSDSAGCGAVTSPCRSLRQAVINAPAGGYVVLQGPANFGPAPTINKSLSIVGEGGAMIFNDGRAIGGRYDDVRWENPLNIEGGDDIVVRLRGLTIDGGSRTGTEGVWLQQGARLEIADCVIRNFLGGIVADLSYRSSTQRSFVSIVDSVLEEAGAGIRPGSHAGVSAFVDGLKTQNSGVGFGVVLYGSEVARAVVTNSAATSSRPKGLFGFRTFVDYGDFLAPPPPGAGLFIVKSLASGYQAGVSTEPNSDRGSDGLVSVSRSVIVGNDAANSGSKLTHSYGNNAIRGNTDDTPGKFSLQPLH